MSGLSDSDIKELLHRFYRHVRSDHLLGPVFNGIVANWAEHLVRLEEFWSSLMLASGRYKGNPVTMHTMHAHQLRPEMFHRWLEIWQATTIDMLSTEDAAAMR